MENPHEKQQRRLIRRVVHSVEQLQATVQQINNELETLEPLHEDIERVGTVWAACAKNISLALQSLPHEQ